MQQNRFASLQALRGLAALAVVLFHLRGTELKYLPGTALLDGVARYADAGVDLFFVLSGFVMTTISAGRYGGVQAAGSFLVRRAWRVLPPYWLFTTLVVVLMLLAPGMVNSSYHGQSILSSYLLLPHAQLPVLTVGWTLVHEVWFYLAFAAAIAFVPERFVTAYLLLWAAAVVLLRGVMPADASPAYQLISNPLTLEFIAGGLLGLYWRRLPQGLGVPLLIAGLGLAVAAAVLLPAAGPASMSVWTRVAVFGSASALLVAGAVLAEAAHRLPLPRWLGALGDSSYALYLTHIFVLSAVGRIWMMLLPSPALANHAAFVLTNVLACCVVGWLTHRWVEQPLLRWPQQWRRARR